MDMNVLKRWYAEYQKRKPKPQVIEIPEQAVLKDKIKKTRTR